MSRWTLLLQFRNRVNNTEIGCLLSVTCRSTYFFFPTMTMTLSLVFPTRLVLRFRQQRGLLGCQLKRGFLSFKASSRNRRGATLVAIVCRREADKRGRVLRKKKRKSGANFRSRKPVALGNLLSTHTCSFCIKTSKMTQHWESRAWNQMISREKNRERNEGGEAAARRGVGDAHGQWSISFFLSFGCGEEKK